MDVKLPQLAEGVESGTVVNILVSEGQEIKKDQAFMELETQKAVGSIPSPSSGTVTKVHVKEGMEVSVGQVLISIESGSKTAASEAKNSAPSPSSNRAQPNVAPAPSARTAAEPEAGRNPAETFHYHSSAGMAPPAPPSVRRIGHEPPWDRNAREFAAVKPAEESAWPMCARTYSNCKSSSSPRGPAKALPPLSGRLSIFPNGVRFVERNYLRCDELSAAACWSPGQLFRK